VSVVYTTHDAVPGHEAVSEMLAARGFDTVFSMLGGTNVPWIGAGVESGRLRLVPTRHEATCVSAAVGYARSTGRIGLCSVSRGPGFANAVNALIAAVRNHSPLVMVVAESPSPDSMTAQNVDQRAFTELIGAGFHHARTLEEFAEALDAAVGAARWDGQPQVLSMADGMLHEQIAAAPPQASPGRERGTPDATSIERAVDLLVQAERPLILAGQGAVHAESRAELVALAEATGSRLATSILAAQLFAGHPQDLGISGGWAPVASRQALRAADLVLVFGASFNQFTAGHGKLYDDAVVIQCDVNPDAIGEVVPVDLPLVGDARSTAEALLAAWDARRPEPRLPPPPLSKATIRESVRAVPLDRSNGLDPREVYQVLDEVLPPERLIVTDSGRTLPTLPTLVGTRTARDFLVGRGYGSIGLGLGTAIGAAAGRPDAHVVLVCGDGGLMMSAQELDAVRLAGLRLTIVVMNDLQYGAEIKHLRQYGLPDTIAQQAPPDLVRLAEAFDGVGTVVETLEELSALELRAAGLHLVDVRIDPEVEGSRALGTHGENRLGAGGREQLDEAPVTLQR
jgi:thiamine pyrophosphate-dependent acetolactate synthase large subunit-like protein